MEQNPENYDFGLKDANVKIMNRNTENVIKGSHHLKKKSILRKSFTNGGRGSSGFHTSIFLL